MTDRRLPGLPTSQTKTTGSAKQIYRLFYFYRSFIYSPTDTLASCLKKNNITVYIKIYIKTAPTCFGVIVTPSSASALICAYYKVAVVKIVH